MHPVEIISERLQPEMTELGYHRAAPFPEQAPDSIKQTWCAQFNNGRLEFRILWPSRSLEAWVSVHCLTHPYDFAIGAPISITLPDITNSRKTREIRKKVRNYLSDESAIFDHFEKIKEMS